MTNNGSTRKNQKHHSFIFQKRTVSGICNYGILVYSQLSLQGLNTWYPCTLSHKDFRVIYLAYWVHVHIPEYIHNIKFREPNSLTT